jgi:hypothetical protein
MAKATYEKQITALLVVDPYNDFISEGGKDLATYQSCGRSEQLRSAHGVPVALPTQIWICSSRSTESIS